MTLSQEMNESATLYKYSSAVNCCCSKNLTISLRRKVAFQSNLRLTKNMSSILCVIRLKHSVAQLTDDEFDAIFSKFRKKYGREYVMQMVCAPIKQPCEIDVESIERMTDTVSSIMHERDPNQPTFIGPSNQSITDLPTCLVGEVASYLDQKSYFRLSSTNRKMFVDTHSPNRLTKVSLAGFVNPGDVSSLQFSGVRHLVVSMASISELNEGVISEHFPKMEILNVWGVITDSSVCQFVQQNSYIFPKIKTLALLYCTGTSITFDALHSLLSESSALENVQLRDTDFSRDFDKGRLGTLCPKINRPSCVRNRCATLFLSAFSSKLTTLTLQPFRWNTFTFPVDCDWSQLQRLCLWAVSQQAMRQILGKTKKLREFCFAPNVLNYERMVMEGPMAASEIVLMTEELITKYVPSMEFLYIATRGHFAGICNAIHRGLFLSQKQHRECLEIGLYMGTEDANSVDDMMCNVSKLLLALRGSNTKQWMLTLSCSYLFNVDAVENGIEEFLFDSYPDSHFVLKRRTAAEFIIANADCKMLGHRHWWNDCNETDFYSGI